MITGHIIYDKIDSWHFKFSDDRWSGEDYSGSFQITDVQGFTHMTELAPINNLHRKKAVLTPEVIEGEDYKIDVEAYVENVKRNPNLEINIDIEKNTFREKRLYLKDYHILVNDEYSVRAYTETNILDNRHARIQIMSYSDELTGFGEIEKLDFIIAVEDRQKSDNMEYIPISLQCEGMDVSSFARSEAQFDTVSECVTDDANYRLMALRREKNGNLSGTIFCENSGDSIVKHSIRKVIINGIQTDHSYVSFDIYTFAKSSMYVDFSVDVSYMDSNFIWHDEDAGVTVQKNTLLETGIDDISTIEFIGDTGSEQPYKIKFSLTPPFTYRTEWDEKNDINNAENAAVQIAEKQGCIISVAEVKRRDGVVYTKLLLKNTSAEDIKVILSNGMFENIEADISFADDISPLEATIPVYAKTTVIKVIRLSSDKKNQKEKTPGGECRLMMDIVKDQVRYPLSLSMTLGDETEESNDNSSFNEIPLSEITLDCVDLSVSGGNQPLLDSEVLIPAKYSSLKKEFMVDLSDENLSEIQKVSAGVVRRIKDLAEVGYEGDASKAGEFVAHLHWQDLEDCGGGIYKGAWSGMLLKIVGVDNSFIQTTDCLKDGNWTMEGDFRPIFNDEYKPSMSWVNAEFNIAISDGIGVINDFVIKGGDRTYDDSLKLWKEVYIYPVASELFPDGDGAYVRDQDVVWILEDPPVPVEGKSFQLELIPAEDMDDLEIIYLLTFKDKTQKILGFEPYSP